MNDEKVPVTELHSEIGEWRSTVDLVRSEISTFQKQLAEIASKNTHEEVMKGVEHFQNQFIRQLEVSDELRRALRKADHRLAATEMNGNGSDNLWVEDNTALRDKAITYMKLFTELKNEYHSFLEKWM
ncbi:MAG TPA: hypothetical protein VG847_07265 [Chitinophagaceae bacterium]|nr:hypothetical protein [Chitinophagaceae bacterium]